MEDQTHDYQDNGPHLSFGKFLMDCLSATGCFYSGVFEQPVIDVISTGDVTTPTSTLSQVEINRQVRRKSHILNDEKYLEGLLTRWAISDNLEK